MNKYLEKIAEKLEKTAAKDDNKPVNLPGRVGLGYLGATAGMIGSSAVVPHLQKSIIHEMNHEHGISNHGTVRKFMRDNGMNRHNMTLNHRPHVSKQVGQELGHDYEALHKYHDSPAEITHPETGKHVLVGTRNKATGKLRNMDVMMHELGHAKDFNTHTSLKNKLQRFGNTKANEMALAGVAAMSNEKTRHYAPAVAAVPGALVLRSEAMANYHAYKGIKAHKGAAEARKFLTRTVPKQMLPYAVAAGGAAAGLHGANKLIDYINKKKKERGDKSGE